VEAPGWAALYADIDETGLGRAWCQPQQTGIYRAAMPEEDVFRRARCSRRLHHPPTTNSTITTAPPAGATAAERTEVSDGDNRYEASRGKDVRAERSGLERYRKKSFRHRVDCADGTELAAGAISNWRPARGGSDGP
jgi:hypothetical protein